MKGFKFQLAVCNGCHDLLMMSMSLNDTSLLNIHGVDCRCTISKIIKCKAINLLLILVNKRIIIKYKTFLIMYKKIRNEIITFGDNEI